MKDAYAVLGVSKDITKAELKQVYTRFAKKYHPDKPTGNAVKFRALNQAYKEIKADIVARAASFEEMKAGAQAASFFPEVNPSAQLRDFDPEKFNAMFDEHYVDPVECPERPPEPPPMPTQISGDVADAYADFVRQHAPPPKQSLVHVPQTTDASQLQHNKLGVVKVDDYSHYGNKRLLMTDYRKGYTMQPLHDPGDVTEQDVTLANATKQRNVSLEYSAEEQRIFETHLEQREREQHQARNNQVEMDRHALARFNRMMFTINHAPT